MSEPSPLTGAFEAADRFRGEETANLGRALMAVGLLATGQPYGALALATLVLVMAIVLRSGHAWLVLSVVTVAIDTEVLVFFVHQPTVPVMVTCATAAVALASLRMDARLVAGAAFLAWLGLRAHVVGHRFLSHGASSRQLTSDHYFPFLVPVAVAAVLGITIMELRARRIRAHLKRASGPPPTDEQAGYRQPAAAGISGVGVCASCHAPVLATKKVCWLCRADVEGDRTLDASRVFARVFDPREGRRRSVATAALGTATGLAAFASLVNEVGTPMVLVTPAIFVIVALLPMLQYVRSPAGRRGEMLESSSVPQPIGIMLAVALAFSTLVLVVASLGVIVAAICTGMGFPMR